MNELRYTKKRLLQVAMLMLVLLMCAPAWGATYVLKAPSGMTTFHDKAGGVHHPYAAGHVTLTDPNLLQGFLNAGFVLKTVATTASHDYGAAQTDWTLSTSENAADVLYGTNAGGAVNALATPTSGKLFLVVNASGANLTIKASGGTGITVANGASVFVRGTGTDFAAAGLSAAVAASATAAGIVELATTAETVTGTATDLAVTPADVTAKLSAPGPTGDVTPGTGTFTTLAFSNLTTVSHDYAGANAAWTLSAAEARGGSFSTTNAAVGATTAVVPAGFVKLFHVKNTSGQTVTYKYTASTGVAVATDKQAVLFGDGTEIVTVVAAY